MSKFTFLRAVLLVVLISLIPMGSLQARSAGQVIPGETRPVRFETINIAEGLSQSTVWTVLQDQQGFMWFGTDDGLNRYDGYSFQIFRHDAEDPASLRSNGVTSLYEDREGNLWVGTIDGLDRFDASSETFIHYGDTAIDYENLETGGILSMLEDSDGNFWLGTSGAGLGLLDRRNGNILRFTTNPEDSKSISGDYVTSLLQDDSGAIWVGTYSGLNLFDRSSRTFTRFTSQRADTATIGGNHVRSLFRDRSGIIWISTDDGGLTQYTPFGKQFTRIPVGDNSLYGTSSNTVTGVLEDDQGYLWIATRRGLDRMNRLNGTFTHYRHDPNDPNTLSNDTVLSLYIDQSGVLWAGTYGGGISKYNRYSSKFQLYQHSPSQPNSMSNDRVLSVYENDQGILWVGTMDGGLNRIDRKTGEVKVYQYNPEDPYSLSSNEVTALLKDYQGVLWVGTTGGGLNRFDDSTGQFTHYQVAPSYINSISDNDITVLFEDSQKNLWVGTRNGGLNLFNRQNSSFTHFQSEVNNSNSLSDDYVRSIWEDDEGYLWIGTQTGLNRLHPISHRAKRYRHNPRNANSLNSDTILSIYQDTRGVLWVGTNLGGLNRFDWETETFKHYTESNGLSNDTVFGILEDRHGNLWLSTNKGLSEFDPRTETFRNYDVQDGLQSNEFNAGAYFENNNGELFFGGVNGLNVFDPELLEINPNPPPVVVTAYKEYNQTQRQNLAPDELIELPYSVNFISFEFVALDYNAPVKNQYAYMLEGFDQDWVYAGTRRYVNYTNLKGGDYVFRVRGSNNDGVWNEAGVSVRIHVIPPFWQSWWFIGLIALGLGTLVWGGYYVRVKSVEALNRGLEQQVRERTMEIERRRQVAEGLREIIAILNSNRSLEESLDYIINQMTRLMGAQVVVLFQKVDPGVVRVIASNQKDSSNIHFNFVPDWIAARILNGEVLRIPDLQSYRKRYDEDFEFPLEDHCAIIAVPFSVGVSVDGGLMLIYEESQIISDDDIKTAFTFADQGALAIANAQLRARAEEIAVTTERSRLARDLHDAVTQTLFATSLIAEVLPKIWERNPDEGRKRLLEVRELTRGALAEMRMLLMELRPSALLDTPLADLLHQLCDAFQGRARIPVELIVEDREKLPPDTQVMFYRVAQEGLSNIAKHAHAEHVQITYKKQDGQVHLEIADDGVGFDPLVTPPDHFGLVIMKERALTVGATCAVESRPGKGTLIRLSWRPPDGKLQSLDDQRQPAEQL